jgi:hypothetical protein
MITEKEVLGYRMDRASKSCEGIKYDEERRYCLAKKIISGLQCGARSERLSWKSREGCVICV